MDHIFSSHYPKDDTLSPPKIRYKLQNEYIQVSDTCQQKLYAEEQPQHVSGITSTECNVNTHKLTLLTFNIEGLAGNSVIWKMIRRDRFKTLYIAFLLFTHNDFFMIWIFTYVECVSFMIWTFTYMECVSSQL